MSTLESTRRDFLKATTVVGATAAVGVGATGLLSGPEEAIAAAAVETKIVKSTCHQCPARCGIDVRVEGGRVTGIEGTLDHPISNGKLCPKGPLGAYILYDPDRHTGPMKRTNPEKGRNVDPKYVSITWDEALDTLAKRMNALREKGEGHRFSITLGRGWGNSDDGQLGPFAKMYGSPNVGLGHSSLCSDASKKGKLFLDGNYAYNSYDYRNANYLLFFGAAFLEAYRPLNANLQTWGHIRTKAPKTKVTVVDIRLTTTGAAADHLLMIKPGTDGALALAIAHVILTEGLWDRKFVGDFADGKNLFKTGETLDPASFKEKWTKDLIAWWNAELKDRTPAWAAAITTIPEKLIVATAREFGTTRPAMAIFERGATTCTNATYNAMSIHSLNALVGAFYAKGGLGNQMSVPFGKLPVKPDDYMDDIAKAAAQKKMPRIDRVKTAYLPMASNQWQEVAKNHLAGNPYKMDTMVFWLTNPMFSGPDCKVWEEALKDIFVVDTSPFPSETSVFADLILPDHTYLERWNDIPTYPFQGWPMAGIRQPAVKPIHNTMAFTDVLIELGKRINGPMSEYYKVIGNTETILRHLAKGFEANPGDNGVNSFETWIEKGVWYKKPYAYRQVDGEFYQWDGEDYRKPMTPEDVKAKLLKTESGKFEFKASYLEHYADFIQQRVGVAADRVGFPQWVAPKYTGKGDLFFVTPKTPLHAEGRSANIPNAVAIYQPNVGGRGQMYLEINPNTAKARGIKDGDRVKISSDIGSINATARYFPGARPDTVVLPYGFGHWAHGRWAKSRNSGNVSEIIPNVSDPISGLTSNYGVLVTVEKA
ncbi:MAG: twin-arginine translocation signal domain-containing protein [Magnetospirillum sp.]|nr:MAG: twin-arginine translocation signal domain-containing protein [Magnetospirillum sp.]